MSSLTTSGIDQTLSEIGSSIGDVSSDWDSFTKAIRVCKRLEQLIQDATIAESQRWRAQDLLVKATAKRYVLPSYLSS